MNNIYVIHALLAAALFGASTPFAKLLVGAMSPWLLAGLLYLGSGLGLAAVRLVRDRGWTPSGLTKGEWPWLLGAIFFGGVVGPLALMFGLTRTSGSTASLLLNLEAVLTAVIAWVVFKENADRRIVLGMLAIVAGGAVLSWSGGDAGTNDWLGPLAIVVACLCWAIDNNLTRRVSASDALFVAGAKGAVAGSVKRRAGIRARRESARCSNPARDPGCRPTRLRHQPGALRACFARPGHGAHRCLLLDRALHRRGRFPCTTRRIDLDGVLDRCRSDGLGRLAAPHRTPRA